MSSVKESSLNLNYGWDYGESGWHLGVDENFVLIGFHANKRIKGILSTPPSSGLSNGDAYIIGSSATGVWIGKEDKVAIYDRSSWLYITPNTDAFVYNESDSEYYIYTTSWIIDTNKTLFMFQTLKRLAAEAGYNLVNGSFEEGGELTSSTDVLWYKTDGKYYQWSVDEAKTVVAGSSPTNVGTDWIDKSNVTFKDNLADPDSTVLIAGVTANDLIALLQDTLTFITSQPTVPDTTKIDINTQTGTSYTLALTDKGICVEMNNAAANTLTIPPNSSVAFPVNTTILIRQQGVGNTTIVAGSGVTIRNPHGTLKIAKQYATVSIHQRAIDEWCIDGNMAEA